MLKNKINFVKMSLECFPRKNEKGFILDYRNVVTIYSIAIRRYSFRVRETPILKYLLDYGTVFHTTRFLRIY